jgi:hypothetical protein
VFVDGSFANNKDFSSQIGYLIILTNETLAREQSPRIEFNEANSTRELLVLWMKYVSYTQT